MCRDNTISHLHPSVCQIRLLSDWWQLRGYELTDIVMHRCQPVNCRSSFCACITEHITAFATSDPYLSLSLTHAEDCVALLTVLVLRRRAFVTVFCQLAWLKWLLTSFILPHPCAIWVYARRRAPIVQGWVTCLRVHIPSRYVTSQLGQLILVILGSLNQVAAST